MEKELELIVFERFKLRLDNDQYNFKLQDRWQTKLLIRRFDIVIYYEENPLIIIEVKSKLFNKNRIAIGTDQIRSAISITNARYGILTDNEQFYFYERSTDSNFETLSFNEVIKRIKEPTPLNYDQDSYNKIKDIFLNSAINNVPKNKELISILQNDRFENQMKFNNSSNCFCFDQNSFQKSHIENKIFSALIGEFKDTTLCRYSSFDTIFSMINFLSVRLNGIAGMNDKTEINYVDTYLENYERPISTLHHNTVSAINKRYITSCSDINNKDNLTLWRLYGDDAKGSCMVFKVINENITDNILLRKVKYADDKGSHPELNFIKEIVEEVENLLGFKFEFRKIGVWKHFFKPYEYSIEDEVRLLIIDEGKLSLSNKGWVKTYSHSILNPFIDFELNSSNFPLELREIILGPKCPEQELNKIQLEEMIRRKKKEIVDKKKDTDIKKLKVVLSDINHYR